MLVVPSDTLPKFTAAGLALSAAEDAELDVAEVEVVAAAVETPLALVMPVQPDKTTLVIKTEQNRAETNRG